MISTVSGGSIVGALYYLHAQEAARERKPDAEITDADYVEIVAARSSATSSRRRRKNVRARAFANLFKNVADGRPPTTRAATGSATCTTACLYQPAWERDADGCVEAQYERPRKRFGVKSQVELRELLIKPAGRAATASGPTSGNGCAAAPRCRS